MLRTLLFFFFVFIILSSAAFAQSDREYVDMVTKSENESNKIMQDTTKGWTFDWVGGFNGSQASYRNWSQGGVNTVNLTTSTLFNIKYRKDKFGYNLVSNFKYGQARIEGEGTRKTDDKIAIANQFKYLFDDSRFSAFGNLNFSTQFDKGYDYGEEPKKLLSRFMAPAYLSQTFGVGFNPNDYFTAQAGVAMKETIVNDTDLSTRYGLGEGEKIRFEPGYSIIFNFEKNLVSNVRLVSSLETFSNLNNNVKQTDVHFSNEIIGKINDFLNTSFQFVLVYDEDFSRELQIKQVLSVGFSFSLL